MSMQIKAIYLYNKKGDIRELKFKIGDVNIIAGKSDTGKSAIIAIIEYCLGQSRCEIPDGVIRSTVKWYSVLYTFNDTEVFIAKPAPSSSGGKSQRQVYIEVGQSITPPTMDDLTPNATDDSITASISSMLGISSNLSLTGPGKSQDAFEANLRHTTHYLYQENDVIVSKHTLFHKQQEDWGPRTIRSTLPYFLGVLQEDRLRLENQLYEARRKERVAQRKYSEVSSITSERLDNGKSLLAEARQVGLVFENIDETNSEQVISALKKTQSWKPQISPTENVDLIQKLSNELSLLRQDMKDKGEQIGVVEKYIHDANGYSSEVSYQKQRLESINVFSDINTNICPLCHSSSVEINIPSIEAINNSLGKLNANLQLVTKERPKLEEYLKELKFEKEKIIELIQERKKELNAIESENEFAQNIKNENARISRVLGRISYYLEHIELTDELQPLQTELENAQRTVEFLEKELDKGSLGERQDSIINLISYWMTEWAKSLNLEYSHDYHYQFDLDKLTVHANLPDRIVPLSNMGGGRNIVGCHIITLFALHKYFITQNRPVPGFIILDQPTQGFFVTTEEYKKIIDTNNANQISQDDRQDMQNMFAFFFDVCKQLAPKFQIIILEHAQLNNPQYQNALVEEPWNGVERALIPNSWIEDE